MRRHKFGAVATVVDGHKFPSKAEAKRYQELRLLERAGKITDLRLQPRYDLHVNGQKIGEFRADFCYFTSDGAEVVEDVKGVDLPFGRWKRKHLKAQWGIDVVVVK